MKLGVVERDSVDGKVPRLVAWNRSGGLVDLQSAERLRRIRHGASEQAATRISQAIFPCSMRQALEAGEMFFESARVCVDENPPGAQLDAGTHRILPPIDPRVLRDCLAFEAHLRNAFLKVAPRIPQQFYELPLYYKGNPTTLIGHDAEVPWPAYTERLDYELEVGFVVGKAGRDLTPEQAEKHILGVTLFNDFSARDIQSREMAGMLGPAKGKDFATGLGPWIVTTDEMDVGNIELMARVNGEEWSRGNTADMMWRASEIVAWVSQGEGILVGDVIGSGTVGNGCALELGRSLKPGDAVELEAPGIGMLRNTLGSPAPAGWFPTPRTPRTP